MAPGSVLTTNVIGNPVTNTVTTTTTSLVTVAGTTSDGSSARWKALMPGEANFEAFKVVGHSLFALLAGLLGAVIARRYHARQERALEAGREAPV